MNDIVNLWFVAGSNKKGVPRVFSKVLLNFMLGRYPTTVFEKFSKYRLENILEELLTKTTDKSFFTDMRPMWWPESIEFLPLPVLQKKVESLSWILCLQELLLSAREFYAEQLYMARKSSKAEKVKDNDKLEKVKRKAKVCIKISPAIFKPFRNENCHPNSQMPNIAQYTLSKSIDSNGLIDKNMKQFLQLDVVLANNPINISVLKKTCLLQSPYVRVEDCLKRSPLCVPIPPETYPFPGMGWKPFVYLDDILRKPRVKSLNSLNSYANDNCKVRVYDILRPIASNPIEKTSYMNLLGLSVTPTTPRREKDLPRTVNYKRYSPKVPFSSVGGQLITGSFKDRYYHNGNTERIVRRGCSINYPLRHKVPDTTVTDPNVLGTKSKIRSYHVYKFCRRRPLNTLDLPMKIRNRFCRNTIVKLEALSTSDLRSSMPDCKVLLTGILPCHAKYLQKCRVQL